MTATGFDGQGRAVSRTDPLSNTTHTAYDHAGNVTAQWVATYPVAYEYDTQGRRTAMATTRDDMLDFSSVTNSSLLLPPSSFDRTAWLYDNATGLLTNKVYADGSRVRYAYTPSGLLASRVWARGVTAVYACDAFGQVTNTAYSDDTPQVSYAYDRLGNLSSSADAAGSRAFSRAPGGETLTETVQREDGLHTLHELYDAFGRSAGYALSNTVGGASALISAVAQSHDESGRIQEVTVAGIAAPFRYGWLPGTDLQASLILPNGVTRETVHEPFRGLPASVSHTNASGTLLSRRTFSRDAAGHLTGRAQYRFGDATNRLDSFAQNARGELVSAVLGSNGYAYAFDPVGSRRTADEPGFSAAYSANVLNQYACISNSAPPAEFIPGFDADGNQTLIRTSTGVWNVEYNAENRPSLFTRGDGTQIRLVYDYLGRCCARDEDRLHVISMGGGHYVSYWENIAHERYLSRGYLRIAALDMLNNASVIHAAVWAPSEPMATRPLFLQTPSGWFACGFDQVKDVTELFDSSGNIAAAYDYAPFGGTLSATGSAAGLNPFRFSSEVWDESLGLVQYTFRPYNPLDGRFTSRDPIEEPGGLNLYGFVANDPVNRWDYLGLWEKGDMIEGGRRRVYIRQNGDTLEGLATRARPASATPEVLKTATR